MDSKPTIEKFEDFRTSFYRHYNAQPKDIRKGQALMNYLHEVWKELHDSIVGTRYDCFYFKDQESIIATMGYLWEKWPIK